MDVDDADIPASSGDLASDINAIMASRVESDDEGGDDEGDETAKAERRRAKKKRRRENAKERKQVATRRAEDQAATPLDETTCKGFGLLKKAGWVEGEGLGKRGDGRRESIRVVRHVGTKGLG